MNNYNALINNLESLELVRIRENIDNYINENYVYSEYYMKKVDYMPSYTGGITTSVKD